MNIDLEGRMHYPVMRGTIEDVQERLDAHVSEVLDLADTLGWITIDNMTPCITIGEETYQIDVSVTPEPVLHLTRYYRECVDCPYWENDDPFKLCNGCHPEKFPDGKCNTEVFVSEDLSNTYDFHSIDEIKEVNEFPEHVRNALVLLYQNMEV